MLKASFKKYTLNFTEERGTSRGWLQTKESWFIVIYNSDNKEIKGIGECSYLPNLNPENYETYEEKVNEVCERINEYEYWLNEGLAEFPSIHFGLETALLDLKSEGSKVLFDSDFSLKSQTIPINGLIWMGDFENMMNQVRDKIAQNFRCIKLKIGAIDFEQELKILQGIRNISSNIELRVDANGAFTPENALEKLTKLANFNIHSIEQPIKQGQFKEMKKLCNTSPIPIALDEELIGKFTFEAKKEVLEQINPQYIILKPSLIGGIKGSEEWIKLAEEKSIKWWITSALESNIGLNAIAQFVATKNNKMFQGLGTGKLYTNNIPSPLTVVKDEINYDLEKDWDLSQIINYEKIKLNGKVFSKEAILKTNSLNFESKEAENVLTFLKNWFDNSDYFEVQTSGSTGEPKTIKIPKQSFIESAKNTCNYLNLNKKTNALLCIPVKYIGGKMMVIRGLVSGYNLIIGEVNNNPLRNLNEKINFIAITPYQAYNVLENNPKELGNIKNIIIGGGSVNESFIYEIKDFENYIYSTFGMTETVSHIALRKLNGKDKSEYFEVLEPYKISKNEDGCLVIHCPTLSKELIVTNDIIELNNNKFKWLGRKDYIINSGGIKINPEEIEKIIAPFLPGINYYISSVLDDKLGNKLVLKVEKKKGFKFKIFPSFINSKLEKYKQIKEIIYLDSFDYTENEKVIRN